MLPYTAEIYYAELAAHLATLWPAALLAVFFALTATVQGQRRDPRAPIWAGRALALGLAAIWAFIGATWHMGRFADLNFMAPHYGRAFMAQAALLVLWGAVMKPLHFQPVEGATRAFALGAILFGLFLLPVLHGLFGAAPMDWPPLFGAAPEPTAFVTLGLLLFTVPRTALVLAVGPLLWLLASGAQAWVLGAPVGFIAPVLGVLVMLWRGRRALAP